MAPRKKATDEQKAIGDRLMSLRLGESLAVEAYAGCAKTTTIGWAILNLIRDGVKPQDILYTSFQSSIVSDSKQKLPRGVHARTFNSLAFRDFADSFSNRLRSPTGSLIASVLGLYEIDVPCLFESGIGAGRKQEMRNVPFTPAAQGYWLLNGVKSFCRSTDPEISKLFLERINPLPDLKGGTIRGAAHLELTEVLAPKLERLWSLMSDLDGSFPAGHEVYVKLWHLSDPVLPYRYIFFDEFQDADPIMIDIVDRQPARKVWTGDRYQQIFSWRGAQNALERVQADYHLNLSQTFRFGPELAEPVNELLSFMGSTVPLVGFDAIRTVIDPPNLKGGRAHIHRTNAGAIKDTIDLAVKGVPFSLNLSSSMKSQIQEIDILFRKGRGTGSLAMVRSVEELREMISYDDSAGSLSGLVELYEKHGAERMVEMVERRPSSDANAVIVTNAHQCKGLEFKQTLIGDDFRHPKDRGWSEEETRLAYVGMTRAQNQIKFTTPLGVRGFTAQYRNADQMELLVIERERKERREIEEVMKQQRKPPNVETGPLRTIGGRTTRRGRMAF